MLTYADVCGAAQAQPQGATGDEMHEGAVHLQHPFSRLDSNCSTATVSPRSPDYSCTQSAQSTPVGTPLDLKAFLQSPSGGGGGGSPSGEGRGHTHISSMRSISSIRGMPPIDDIGDIDDNEQHFGLTPAAPVDAGQRLN